MSAQVKASPRVADVNWFEVDESLPLLLLLALRSSLPVEESGLSMPPVPPSAAAAEATAATVVVFGKACRAALDGLGDFVVLDEEEEEEEEALRCERLHWRKKALAWG
jgi:hypothetical protein